MEKHPLHMKNPELQKSPEVERAVEYKVARAVERNTELRESGKHGPLQKEQVPQDPGARIEAYTELLEELFLHPDKEKRKQNLDLFKIHEDLIIKRENFPESYFELQKKVARERGQPVEEIPPKVREQMIDTAIEDQRASLDAWIDYLSSNDAVYPTWFKYYVWKNITKLSQFDKERGEFKKRTDSTVAPFPDIYREPLAKIADLYEKVKADNKALKEPEIQEKFSKKFPTLYTEFIQESLAASVESREETKGQWVTYKQGKKGEAEKLFKSLENKGTGWCTAGRSTAEQQVKSGDFHVYYTNDADGNPTKPRIAIRMEGGNKIGEVRGVLPGQAMDPLMQPVIDAKLTEFGSEADTYRKKSSDMKHLTDIEARMATGEALTKAELRFIYEIDGKIEGFGYQRDPRIKELLSKRNPKEDAPRVLECRPDEIAWSQKDITKKTHAYIGPLFKGVFELDCLESFYTKFPEGRVEFRSVEIGKRTPKEYEEELTKDGYQVDSYAKQLLQKMPGSKQAPSLSKRALAALGKKPEVQSTSVETVRLTVADLGFPQGATNAEIWQRGKDLGLDLCPAEAGPALRLSMKDQPMDDYLAVAMEPITDSDGHPRVFRLYADDGWRWFRTGDGKPDHRWRPDLAFAFARRKH